jgi:hypothetical protein
MTQSMGADTERLLQTVWRGRKQAISRTRIRYTYLCSSIHKPEVLTCEWVVSGLEILYLTYVPFLKL